MTGVSMRDRIVTQMELLGLTRQDLSLRTGLSYSYVCKLLYEGKGNREHPSPQVLEKLAGALGMLPGELGESLNLTETLLYQLHTLPQDEKNALRVGSSAERFSAVLAMMQADPRWPTVERVADVLGLPLENVQAIMAGQDPDTAAIKQLSERTGLSIRFWIRGRFDPLPSLIDRVLEHDDAQGYLEAVNIAMTADISSATVRNLVQAVEKGRA